MEPVEFFKSSDFLSGSIEEFNEYEIIDNKDIALKLLFVQDIPSNYKDILDRIKISTQDQVKEKMRKRK
ncbi:hypothetical protein [Photorhabdus bodei]|uniref:Uncharacterized protein n=1 Tax=Photorhabdus bodei TaxID=2029681 RepID=A0AAW6BP66_9GAMM|nr:hypothetical protein [Photorhabdus bodei]MDB6375223.1 hypothetical protein [Photorhabdus bodei]